MSSFDASKASILENLDAGVDFSFKGSIDAPILELVNFINSHNNYYTTSSCSGRVSIFRSGSSAKHIKWLLVKHRTFTTEEFMESISQQDDDPVFTDSLVTLKCEPFILHINCRDIEAARSLHDIVTLCGFRESGIKLGNKKVILAVRTTANSMELPLAKGSNLIVSDSYLDLIVNECNLRLASNFTRIDKFLLELKKQYQFPTLQLLPSNTNTNNNTENNSNHQLQRWGHTICSSMDTQKGLMSSYIVGGYGSSACEKTENKHTAEHSQRGLESYLHTGEKMNQITINDDSMHAASAIVTLQAYQNNSSSSGNNNINSTTTTPATTVTNTVQLLLLSGGRLSPTAPLECIRLYSIQSDYQPVSYITIGVQPAPRWGHSLTLIRQNQTGCSYLLYGGRDSTNVYNDMYILHISLSPTTTTTTEIGFNDISCICNWEKLDISQQACTLPGRFFHAACMTPLVFPNDDSQNNEYNIVIIQGGVLSINDPVACGKGYVFDPNTSTVTSLFPPYTTSTATSTNNDNIIHDTTATGTSTVVADTKQVISSCIREICRFGHTLTSIGAKTMLLLGGSSFQDHSSNQGYVLDIYIDHAGSYRCSLRTLEVNAPCQACRAHHQVTFDPARRLLEVVGGGALTLAFGAHYCPSWRAQVTFLDGQHSISTNSNNTTPSTHQQQQRIIQDKHTTNNKYNTNFLLNFKNSMQSTTNIPVLFVPASAVRTLKVLLEEKGLLNKKHSITKVEEEVFVQCNTEINAVLQYITVGTTLQSRVMSITEALAVLNSSSTSSNVSIMAVPIIESLATELYGTTTTTPTTTTPSPETALLLQQIAEVTAVEHLLLGAYSTRSSKRTQVNSAQKANELLLALSAQHHLPIISTTTSTGSSTATDSSTVLLSSRFEVVGDVLMLPESYLSGPQWDNILGLHFDTAGNPTSTEVAATVQYRTEVFATLAQCFGLKRIARKAEIDSGPKRESKVRLLYPVVGIADRTGPGSEGWVTVYENKIGFSFDITRVMFCSGNVTERMRMGKHPSSGDVVVDLYSGIGYYAIPLLYHGKAEHVHACEWNPNSVLALRHNLQQAGVYHRCTVYEGDNQISSQQLNSLADRVSLGLLPSSVPGWPLAVRALKKTGGMIHVHENVHENILSSWIEETILKFQNMFLECNKPMKITAMHLEKVKSYAPRVYHVVLDLLCEETK